MVGGQRRRNLKHYQRDVYAHNAAASKAVINDTNDAPQHTRNAQQRKHSSFEAGPSGRLNGEVLHLWRSDSDLFLEEFLRLEGQGDYSQDICVCGEEAATYCCQDCHGCELFCHLCMIRIHDRHLLHRMERWDGISFYSVTLKSMGIRLQLGHASGVQCINPLPAHNDDFFIIDYKGIYEVGLDFCGCAHAKPHIIQLLRVRLFPATTVDPKTAATFWALEYFQMLSFESKVSTFEFYKTAARLTDNTGIHIPKDRYEALLCMMREWRFIKQMKCAGQSHHPDGIGATKPGACTVLCPACPHAGKNLPDGWENAPSEIRFLYALFLAIDANFRLARRDVSSDIVDLGLNRGYAFFVEEHAYKDFICSREQVIQELSSCSSHNAVNLADLRVSHGLAATGAGTIDCIRHNFKWPCSVGDLQKGERYLNMDYLFFSSMQSSSEISTLNISYNIASHVAKCQSNFSFNFIKGVGRTDGEAPEHGWANINPIVTSTREMGPGSRRNILDDHFNDWNWKKICAIGLIFHRKYNFALIEVQERVDDLINFEASLAADELVEWRRDIEAWEADRSQLNLFEGRAMTSTSMTQAAVRLALSMAEAAEIERGNNMSLHDDISPSVLILSGLELEDQQLNVQKGKILQRMNALRRCIDTWARVQVLYMPMPCDDRLLKHEWELREAQAYDTLNDLRTYKDTFIRGQRANTRANRIINNAEHHIDTLSLKYSTARDALVNLAARLGKTDDWERTLRVEWCKARARAHRWEEEVQLLWEEMRRIIAFLDWQVGWWDMQGPRHAFNSLQAGEGALAYAQHQANLRRQMVIHIKSGFEGDISHHTSPKYD
ncbi:uncharacterized protein F5891DRAFT_1130408 [Suillus fuscotomentosus]|uniref:CxC2-like cysteine cluster KDZ transposase-associated domain-containing protein n=1 Tax=Suillus fuscotomentosus TaxID=1912939 RepID=A0AAD4DXR2_9AGAM|nr:uncharacterized protein F5891DRAFT_1130408 [Suillus fuscotomentosus]KAG1896035.1 hypothetical protein F5891DRAFT_1130408 [Suillus fuscotomentosus]